MTPWQAVGLAYCAVGSICGLCMIIQCIYTEGVGWLPSVFQVVFTAVCWLPMTLFAVIRVTHETYTEWCQRELGL